MCASTLTRVKRESDQINSSEMMLVLISTTHCSLLVNYKTTWLSLPMLPELIVMKRSVIPVHRHNNSINEICHQNKSQGSPKFIPNDGLVIRKLLQA